MKAATLARLEGMVRPLVTGLFSHHFVVDQYSRGRLRFLHQLKEEAREVELVEVPSNLERVLWGVKFRSPLMNAAGMDKTGQMYDLFARQGAGGYLAGTTTSTIRKGNSKDGIYLPFVPLPKSRAAINWLGLPNEGHVPVAGRMSDIEKVVGCPVGASVTEDPAVSDFDRRLAGLVHGMKLYEVYGVDFMELNVSCPNTSEGPIREGALYKTLKYVKEHFLDNRSLVERSRAVPVVVKFSNDTYLFEVKSLMDQLFELGFDGVNFGNTVKDYDKFKDKVVSGERKLFDYFTHTFGGGLSGEPLRGQSLWLCQEAVSYLKAGPPSQDFHVIRTGGIACADDVKASESVGVSLNQWFTGYFERFAESGHGLYEQMYKNL